MPRKPEPLAVTPADTHVHGPDCNHDHHHSHSDDAVIGPYRRDGVKPGRNDPCPCGTGKKFKKCHGAAP